MNIIHYVIGKFVVLCGSNIPCFWGMMNCWSLYSDSCALVSNLNSIAGVYTTLICVTE